jgi:hypothetical protein
MPNAGGSLRSSPATPIRRINEALAVADAWDNFSTLE